MEFDELRQRVRAGEAVWLESVFCQLNELYRLRSEPHLRAFYGRSAERGWAVAKYVSF